MFRPSGSLLKLALTRRSVTTTTGAKIQPAPKSRPFRRFLFRVSIAVSLFYAGGVALAEYNDSFSDLFVDNVPFAENIVDLVESYRHFTSSPLTLEELRSKFGVALGEKVVSVPHEGIKAEGVKRQTLELETPSGGNALKNAFDAVIHQKNAVLLKLSPVTAVVDADGEGATAFNLIIDRLNETIARINNHNLAVSADQYADIVEAHQSLNSSVCKFEKDFQQILHEGVNSRTEKALEEINRKYETKLKDDERALTDKFMKELHNYKVELEERTSRQLKEDLKANEQTLLAKHANEVALLSITQVEEFNKILKEKLDTERDGRLAHLNDLDASVGNLGQSIDKLNHLLMKRETITQLTLVLDEIKSKLHSSEERSISLAKDLERLTALSEILPDKPKPCCKSKDLYPPLIDVAITELNSLTKGKEILSNEQLYNRWNLLESDFKTASLLPPNAGILGHTFAKIFSFFIFTKQGSSTDSDLDSVFARVNENLRLTKVDKAVEEVVSLQGWPHILCKGWIEDARRKIEVESLIDVLDCEVRTL